MKFLTINICVYRFVSLHLHHTIKRDSLSFEILAACSRLENSSNFMQIPRQATTGNGGPQPSGYALHSGLQIR
ncbi:hypothetical protein EZS27_005415 [termite gut metagenome]|uniref:Uncharacterized protein n=1 Tax=termite gut metagenome TaxID=433724 RepID=A0A5J4SN12_9ZZZZ